MRHNNKDNSLGRHRGHRKSMLANMATSLIIHKRISTTQPKARALRRYLEPVITKSKEDSTHSRRIAFSYLRDKDAVIELFRTVAPAVGDRPGGYTRTLKTGFRLGDAADMCIIELVDFNETYGSAAASKPKTRRSRRGAGAGAGAKEETTTKKEQTTAKSEKKEETKGDVEKKAAPKKVAPKSEPKAKAEPDKQEADKPAAEE